MCEQRSQYWRKMCNCSFLLTCGPSAGTLFHCPHSQLHPRLSYLLEKSSVCINILQVVFLFFPQLVQVTNHPEPVSQSMSLQQPPQSQYNMPDRDKQLLFSEFEDLSASFRSLYKSVFEQTFNQQGEWCHEIAIDQNGTSVTAVAVTCSSLLVVFPDPWKRLHLIFKSSLLLNILFVDVKIIVLLRSFNGFFFPLLYFQTWNVFTCGLYFVKSWRGYQQSKCLLKALNVGFVCDNDGESARCDP